MTREEAINLLGWLKSKTNRDDDLEAIDMAIEALSAENSNAKTQNSNQETQKSNGDLIYRADAIEAVMAEGRKVYTSEYANAERVIYEADAVEALSMLPSAEQVTGKLKNPCDSLLKDDSDTCKESGSKLDLISRLKASAEAVQGWIPCSERLPNNDGCVLVTIDDGIEFGKYEDGSWSIWVCEHWDKWDAKGTIAWMPLPEPYREDGE